MSNLPPWSKDMYSMWPLCHCLSLPEKSPRVWMRRHQKLHCTSANEATACLLVHRCNDLLLENWNYAQKDNYSTFRLSILVSAPLYSSLNLSILVGTPMFGNQCLTHIEWVPSSPSQTPEYCPVTVATRCWWALQTAPLTLPCRCQHFLQGLRLAGHTSAAGQGTARRCVDTV